MMIQEWRRKHRFLYRALVFTVLAAFVSSYVLNDAWAAIDLGDAPYSAAKAGAPDTYAKLDTDTFAIPAHLGEVKHATKGSTDKVIVHIQDAHCNFYAQNKIAEIIDYLNKEYGITVLNLEGGSGEYDLSVFTNITGQEIRREVAEYFVKKGEVNGAEFYAILNPEKVALWGIEDKDLYLANLKVYRDSLVYKDEVDKFLKELSHILNNLKRHIFTPELLKIDMAYNAYKSGNMEFKEYLEFLIARAKEEIIEVKQFPNLYLISQAMEQEDSIDFKRANTERDILIDELKKRLSQNELRELIANTVGFKTKRISRKAFYNYLLKTARQAGLSVKDYPALSNYIVYVSLFEAVDRSRVMGELDDFEAKIKEPLYRNETERELNVLSHNLALLNNIFSITLTKNDYQYYLDNRDSFDVRNYLTFIDREAPKYKITARPDKDIEKLDGYREEISRFYEYSFKRDDAFLENLRFSEESGGVKSAMIMTGGFHTENLCELFEKEGISYISILPKFTSERDYENPYFDLLAGQTTDVQQMLNSVLAQAALMQVASMMSSLGGEVWGKSNIDSWRASVILRTMLALYSHKTIAVDMGNEVSLLVRLRDDGVMEAKEVRTFDAITLASEGEASFISLNELVDQVHEADIDKAIAVAFKRLAEGEADAVTQLNPEGAAMNEGLAKAIERLEAINSNIVSRKGHVGQAYLERQLRYLKGEMKKDGTDPWYIDNPVTGEPMKALPVYFVDADLGRGFDGKPRAAHPGALGIYISTRAVDVNNADQVAEIIVHEIIGMLTKDHTVATAAAASNADAVQAGQMLSEFSRAHVGLFNAPWEIERKDERRMAGRDYGAGAVAAAAPREMELMSIDETSMDDEEVEQKIDAYSGEGEIFASSGTMDGIATMTKEGLPVKNRVRALPVILQRSDGDIDMSLNEFLGSGAFAGVYAIDGTRAIKVLNAPDMDVLEGNPEALENAMRGYRRSAIRLAKEYGVMKHLEGVPGVPKVLGVGTYELLDQKFYYLIMERAPGRNLREIITNAESTGQRLLPRQVYAIMEKIDQTLEGIHARGVIHGDIKPENIIVDMDENTGEVKSVTILDYGVSKYSEDGRDVETAGVSGTVRYLSTKTLESAVDKADGMVVNSMTGDMFAVSHIFSELRGYDSPNAVGKTTMDNLEGLITAKRAGKELEKMQELQEKRTAGEIVQMIMNNRGMMWTINTSSQKEGSEKWIIGRGLDEKLNPMSAGEHLDWVSTLRGNAVSDNLSDTQRRVVAAMALVSQGRMAEAVQRMIATGRAPGVTAERAAAFMEAASNGALWDSFQQRMQELNINIDEARAGLTANSWIVAAAAEGKTDAEITAMRDEKMSRALSPLAGVATIKVAGEVKEISRDEDKRAKVAAEQKELEREAEREAAERARESIAARFAPVLNRFGRASVRALSVMLFFGIMKLMTGTAAAADMGAGDALVTPTAEGANLLEGIEGLGQALGKITDVGFPLIGAVAAILLVKFFFGKMISNAWSRLRISRAEARERGRPVEAEVLKIFEVPATGALIDDLMEGGKLVKFQIMGIMKEINTRVKEAAIQAGSARVGDPEVWLAAFMFDPDEVIVAAYDSKRTKGDVTEANREQFYAVLTAYRNIVSQRFAKETGRDEEKRDKVAGEDKEAPREGAEVEVEWEAVPAGKRFAKASTGYIGAAFAIIGTYIAGVALSGVVAFTPLIIATTGGFVFGGYLIGRSRYMARQAGGVAIEAAMADPEKKFSETYAEVRERNNEYASLTIAAHESVHNGVSMLESLLGLRLLENFLGAAKYEYDGTIAGSLGTAAIAGMLAAGFGASFMVGFGIVGGVLLGARLVGAAIGEGFLGINPFRRVTEALDSFVNEGVALVGEFTAFLVITGIYSVSRARYNRLLGPEITNMLMNPAGEAKDNARTGRVEYANAARVAAAIVNDLKQRLRVGQIGPAEVTARVSAIKEALKNVPEFRDQVIRIVRSDSAINGILENTFLRSLDSANSEAANAISELLLSEDGMTPSPATTQALRRLFTTLSAGIGADRAAVVMAAFLTTAKNAGERDATALIGFADMVDFLRAKGLSGNRLASVLDGLVATELSLAFDVADSRGLSFIGNLANDTITQKNIEGFIGNMIGYYTGSDGVGGIAGQIGGMAWQQRKQALQGFVRSSLSEKVNVIRITDIDVINEKGAVGLDQEIRGVPVVTTGAEYFEGASGLRARGYNTRQVVRADGSIAYELSAEDGELAVNGADRVQVKVLHNVRDFKGELMPGRLFDRTRTENMALGAVTDDRALTGALYRDEVMLGRDISGDLVILILTDIPARGLNPGMQQYNRTRRNMSLAMAVDMLERAGFVSRTGGVARREDVREKVAKEVKERTPEEIYKDAWERFTARVKSAAGEKATGEEIDIDGIISGFRKKVEAQGSFSVDGVASLEDSTKADIVTILEESIENLRAGDIGYLRDMVQPGAAPVSPKNMAQWGVFMLGWGHNTAAMQALGSEVVAEGTRRVVGELFPLYDESLSNVFMAMLKSTELAEYRDVINSLVFLSLPTMMDYSLFTPESISLGKTTLSILSRLSAPEKNAIISGDAEALKRVADQIRKVADQTKEVYRRVKAAKVAAALEEEETPVYNGLSNMLVGLGTDGIPEQLWRAGIESEEEVALAMEIMAAMNNVYTDMGTPEGVDLTVEHYHNHVHNLGVTNAMLLLARGESARDVKLSFMAAMLHDFHVRAALKDEVGTPASVEETMRQVAEMLGIAGYDAPQEERYGEMAGRIEGLKIALNSFINVSFPGENREDIFNEVGVMIRRTDYASGIAAPEASYKEQAVQTRRSIDQRISADGTLSDQDIDAYMGELNARYAALRRDVESNKTEKGEAWAGTQNAWLDRQQGIEVAHFEALKKVRNADQRAKLHDLGFKLEKGADQSSFYWAVTPETVDTEVVVGLNKELPMVSAAGTYPFFLKPELNDDPGVMKVLNTLDSRYKANFIDVNEFFAARSMLNDEAGEWKKQWANEESSLQLALNVFGTDMGEGGAAERTAAIGKVNGKVVRGKTWVEDVGGDTVSFTYELEPGGATETVSIAKAMDSRNREINRSPEDVVKQLKERLKVRNSLTLGEKSMIEGFERAVKDNNITKVVALEDSADMMGFFGENGVLYLSRSLMDEDNPIAFMGIIHEYGEQGELTPPGYKGGAHIAWAGAGSKRKAARSPLEEEMGRDKLDNIIRGERGLDAYVELLNGKMAEMGFSDAKVTDDEMAWMAYNLDMSLQGKRDNPLGKGLAELLLMGIQDHLDPVANYRFTRQIKDLRKNLIRGQKTYHLLPAYNIFTKAIQQMTIGWLRNGLKAIGVGTIAGTYDSPEDIGKMMSKMADSMRKDVKDGLFPQASVLCLTTEDRQRAEKFLKDNPDIASRFDIKFDDSYKDAGIENAEDAQVDVAKYLATMTQILDIKRKRDDLKYSAEDLKMESIGLLALLSIDGFIDYIDGLGTMTAAQIANEMNKLFQPGATFRVTRVNWAEISDYNASMEEVGRSL